MKRQTTLMAACTALLFIAAGHAAAGEINRVCRTMQRLETDRRTDAIQHQAEYLRFRAELVEAGTLPRDRAVKAREAAHASWLTHNKLYQGHVAALDKRIAELRQRAAVLQPAPPSRAENHLLSLTVPPYDPCRG